VHLDGADGLDDRGRFGKFLNRFRLPGDARA
jgi:hypothetical protein